ncbi:transketolase [Prochlorococcus marinus]|uniref:transketolase n=1 Tax=Prochlorococcus marinus TaxID=1219 RepID=UPI0022B3C474|nr:transketolase [Prochlorococcus marinus]
MNYKEFNYNQLKEDAYSVRKKILELSYKSGGGQHIGGGLSMVEIMCYLYGYRLNISPDNLTEIDRDRFILSKGHGVLGFYPILNHYGIINDETLNTYKQQDSELISHPIKNYNLGIESSNGSLGHGLSYGLGIAHGLKLKEINSKVFILMGDGECNEGSVWEAAMSASTLKIDNLILIIDFNKYQSDGKTQEIINQDQLAARWSSFGWNVIEVNGHDFLSIDNAFQNKMLIGSPNLILAHTIKGKGVDFMENNNSWHHGRLTENLFNEAINILKR